MFPPGIASVGDITDRWWVAHTKSRCEKAFALDLLNQSVPFFLPMFENVSFSGGRKRRLMMPVFPSYVFFAGGDTERHGALSTDRLCRVIPVPDQSELVSDLIGLQRAITAHGSIHPYHQLAVGRRCRVRAGPFMGMEGLIVESDGMTGLALQVRVLGQAVVLTVDLSLLDPMD